jgi:hypothetical protein
MSKVATKAGMEVIQGLVFPFTKLGLLGLVE